MSFQYLEDYLEFLCGTMDANGKGSNSYYVHAGIQTPIKLATYDKSPVTSMGNFCAKARIEKLDSCLTDKQVDLAKKIVFKYRRQLLSAGVTLPEDEAEIQTRYSIRQIDRTKYLKHDVDNKQVQLKFPYDPKKISMLHDYANNSAGYFAWNNTTKIWIADLTEWNLIQILNLFKNEDLKIDDSLIPIVTDLLTANSNDLPRFGLNDNAMTFFNCHPRVFEYMQTLNYDPNNMDQLSYYTSQAVNLGLKIDNEVVEKLTSNLGEQVANIIVNRKTTLPSGNLPNGDWYNYLLAANKELKNCTWILYLTWWTNKTDWSPFENMIKYDQENKNSSRLEKSFVELLKNTSDPIVVVDSIIGKEAIRNFIESNSLKVIYISDIGQTL